MPSLSFYAAGRDFDPILAFLFEQSGCRIFEGYSPFDTSLAEFRSKEELETRYVIGQCRRRVTSVNLMLLPDASADVVIKRINLKPSACDGATFRDRAMGWGLIQFHLGGTSELGVVSSYTNHNSEKRALSWEHAYGQDLGPVSAWDWKAVSRVSNRINRYLQKIATYKHAARPVMPEAAALIAKGVSPL